MRWANLLANDEGGIRIRLKPSNEGLNRARTPLLTFVSQETA